MPASFEQHLYPHILTQGNRRTSSKMVERRRTIKTGQIAGEQAQVSPLRFVSKKSAKADLARWERKFDAVLRPPTREVTVTQNAWDTLIKHGCDPRVVKSALYHAAEYASIAEGFPSALTTFFRRRDNLLTNVAALREQLQELTSLRCGSLWVTGFIWDFYRLREEHASFFAAFPELLERLVRILEIPRALSPKLYGHKSSEFIATGEAPLHVYVDETTGRPLTSKLAILLEAAGWAYGLDRESDYGGDAVRKRYRRFQEGSSLDYRLIRQLVRTYIARSQRGSFHLFMNSEYFSRCYDVAMDRLENTPFEERVRNWNKLISGLDTLP